MTGSPRSKFTRCPPRKLGSSQPFGFVLKDAQAALCTYAPNIWEELHGLADGLKIPLERAAAQYSNSRLSFPKRGCSSVMTNALYGRNYDYSPR